MLTLTRPAVAAVYNAVPIGNDFFFPRSLFKPTTARRCRTTSMGEFNTPIACLFRGLTLPALPIIIVYIVLSRQFIGGKSGALK